MPRPLIRTGMTVNALHVVDREKAWTSRPTGQLLLLRDGIEGDRHYGATRVVRPFESRERAGRTVPNDRQVSIADTRHLYEIAKGMGLPIDEIEEASGMPVQHVLAGAMAVNILVDSPDSDLNELLQPGHVVEFGNEPIDNGDVPSLSSAIKITEYNPPCRQPALPLIRALGSFGVTLDASQKEIAESFIAAAENRRGWVASSYVSGASSIHVGHEVYLQTALLPTPGPSYA